MAMGQGDLKFFAAASSNHLSPDCVTGTLGEGGFRCWPSRDSGCYSLRIRSPFSIRCIFAMILASGVLKTSGPPTILMAKRTIRSLLGAPSVFYPNILILHFQDPFRKCKIKMFG